MKLSKIVFCSMVFLTVGYAQADRVLTVEEAVALAKEQSLELEIDSIHLQATKRRQNNAFSIFLPELAASTNLRTDLDRQKNFNSLWSNSLSLSLELPLQSLLSFKNRADDYHQSSLEYRDSQRKLEKQVRKLFYELLLDQEKIQLEEQKIAREQKRWEQAMAKNKAGLLSDLDLLKERIQLEKSQFNKKKLANALENKFHDFKRLLGLSFKTIRLSEKLSAPLKQTQQWTKIPDNDSPALQKLRFSWEVAQTKPLEYMVGKLLPTLSGRWTTMYANRDFNQNTWDASFNRPLWGLISLTFSLNPWLPWTNEKEEANNLDDTTKKLEIQIRQQRAQDASQREKNVKKLEEIHKYFQILSSLEEVSHKSYDLSVEAYQQGLINFDSLQRAQVEWELARQESLEQHFKWFETILDLEYEENLSFGTLLKDQL